MLVTSRRRERAIDRCGLRGWLLRRRSRCAVTADGESDHRLPGGSSHAIAHWIARRVTSTAACHARRFAGGTGHNSDGSLTQYGGARRRKAHGPARVHHPLRRDGVCQPGATARGQGGQFGDSGAALVEIVHERVPRRRRGYALQIQLPPSGASGRFGVDRAAGSPLDRCATARTRCSRRMMRRCRKRQRRPPHSARVAHVILCRLAALYGPALEVGERGCSSVQVDVRPRR